MSEAVRLLEAGEHTLALGGNSLHRVPHEFARQLALRDDLKLHLVKTAGAYDIDLLCLAELVTSVSAGFIGYETEFGLARHYRREVERGAVEAREHACYTVIAAMRAAAFGLTFLPVQGLAGSDLVEARGFIRIPDPYSPNDRNRDVVTIPAIRPDLAVIHVQWCDPRGNGVIAGAKCEDPLMARAARSVILTTEQIVSSEELPVPIEHVDIPGVLVDAIVEAPGGAWPGSCHGLYTVDHAGVSALQSLSTRNELITYLMERSHGH